MDDLKKKKNYCALASTKELIDLWENELKSTLAHLLSRKMLAVLLKPVHRPERIHLDFQTTS